MRYSSIVFDHISVDTSSYMAGFHIGPLYQSFSNRSRTSANSKDSDEMQHNAAFHQGLHCLLRLKQPSGTEIHLN